MIPKANLSKLYIVLNIFVCLDTLTSFVTFHLKNSFFFICEEHFSIEKIERKYTMNILMTITMNKKLLILSR